MVVDASIYNLILKLIKKKINELIKSNFFVLFTFNLLLLGHHKVYNENYIKLNYIIALGEAQAGVIPHS